VALAAKAGHNDGHHSHVDVGSFVYHLDGESLLCDPGRGMYSKEYFRDGRYQNPFCNALGHSVPVIGGELQAFGPEFGGKKAFHGSIAHRVSENEKLVTVDFDSAYGMPGLTMARRTLRLNPATAEVVLRDDIYHEDGPVEIEEALVTWADVALEGAAARVCGKNGLLELYIEQPAGCVFQAERLEEACRANRREGVLTRITARLPLGSACFIMRIRPVLNPR
jgi:hypothetical protein